MSMSKGKSYDETLKKTIIELYEEVKTCYYLVELLEFYLD